MLLAGVNHVAILTRDTDRLCSFYREVFEATVAAEMRPSDGLRLTGTGAASPRLEPWVKALSGGEPRR